MEKYPYRDYLPYPGNRGKIPKMRTFYVKMRTFYVKMRTFYVRGKFCSPVFKHPAGGLFCLILSNTLYKGQPPLRWGLP